MQVINKQKRFFVKEKNNNSDQNQSQPNVPRVNAAPTVGLSTEQVEERMALGLFNKKMNSSTKTTKQIVKSNIFTYFNFTFLLLGLLLIFVGSFRDLTFLPIIVANTIIGIIQEIRSKNTLDKLSILNAPKATVIREEKKKSIPAEQLVLDDIVVFSAGNQIPADAQVLDGEVTVNEALITGEADEITKKAEDTLLSGSFIVSGSCVARLDKVGENSYISSLMKQATQTKNEEQSEMIRSLDRLLKVVGVMIIPIGLILFYQQYIVSGSTLQDSITSMVAAIIGMIPEGLYLLTSVAMVVSVMRLAGQKVLVHDMKCIETLARVNILCVDKTGTITVPEMEVEQMILLDNGFAKTQQTEESSANEHIIQINTDSAEEIKQLLSDFVSHLPQDNATMAALQDYFSYSDKRQKANKVFSFSSRTKYSGVILENISYVVGAPEFVLREDYEAYQSQIEEFSEKGYRVLIFGVYSGTLDGKPLTDAVKPLALIILNNAIRKGAVETFHYFAEQGVEVKVISGDNPVTVSEIAKKAGICNAERYVDASLLTDGDDIDEAMQKYTVFGRVTPEQKRLFVKSLKRAGNTVAMTGDGVNDILALKDADCSIAMASGSDAASQVSQLVLLDNDFNRMPSIVMEGRRVVNNIGRTASLYLVKNIFSMLLAIFSVIAVLDYPLKPSQVSLISLFTIGIPSFFLALEPNKDRIEGRFLSGVLVKALPAGLTDFFVVSAMVLFCKEFGIDAECVSTSSTILVMIVGIMILYKISKPITIPHAVLIVAMITGCLICMINFRHMFTISDITKQSAMLLAVFSIVTEPVLRYLSLLTVGVQKLSTKLFTRG